MLKHTDFTTSVLLIDANDADRKFYTESLICNSPDYRIFEASDAESGLALYRSERIDCVILELDFEDRSGFELLVTLVPIARRPNVAVIILTRLTHLGLWDLAKRSGAYACLIKGRTSGEMLDNVIQKGIAIVGMLPKEDRYRSL